MSLQKDIYHKIKTGIIYGELSPGEKLSEVELAKKLNSSRTPIREAFRQLQMEGYITVSPNKGAYVSKLPPGEIEEIYHLVSLLEGYAAELAAQKIGPSGLEDLKKIQKKLVLSASRNKYQDYIQGNTDFHDLIAHWSGNRNLIKINKELRMRIYRYRLISVTIPGYLNRYVSDHEKIIDAIEKKDSVHAREHMKRHVHFVKEVLVHFLEKNPGI